MKLSKTFLALAVVITAALCWTIAVYAEDASPTLVCMNCEGPSASFDLGVTCEFVSGEWQCGPRGWAKYESGVSFGNESQGVTLGRLLAEMALGLRNADLITTDTGETITPSSIRIAAGYKFYFSKRSYDPPPVKDGTPPDKIDSRPRVVLIGAYAKMGGEFSPTSDQLEPNFARQWHVGLNVEARRGDETTLSLYAGVGEDGTLNPPGSAPKLADGTFAKTLVGIVEGSVPIVRKGELSGKIVGRVSQQLINQAILKRGARVEIAAAAGWK